MSGHIWDMHIWSGTYIFLNLRSPFKSPLPFHSFTILPMYTLKQMNDELSDTTWFKSLGLRILESKNLSWLSNWLKRLSLTCHEMKWLLFLHRPMTIFLPCIPHVIPSLLVKTNWTDHMTTYWFMIKSFSRFHSLFPRLLVFYHLCLCLPHISWYIFFSFNSK